MKSVDNAFNLSTNKNPTRRRKKIPTQIKNFPIDLRSPGFSFVFVI